MNTQPASDLSYEDILNKDILELMGAQNMPEEKKEELYQTMAKTIETRVIARIDDQLSDQEAQEWKQIIDEKDPEKNDEFLKRKNIDLAQLYAQEVLIYKTQMVEMANTLDNNK